MPDTPQRGYSYPAENENPYWDSFVIFANEIDADVSALYTAPTKIPYTIMDAAGDLIVGTGSDTAARLPRGTTGQPLLATATTLAYGALDLDNTSAVTGTLGVANGGTNLASGTAGGVLAFTGTTTVASSANGAATTVLHGGAGAVPTFGAVSLTTDVTGVLPAANHDGIPKSLLTTKGDVIVRDASVAVRLPIGAQSTVLTADSGTSTGVGWYRIQGWRGSLIANSSAHANNITRTALNKVITIPASILHIAGTQLVWSIRLSVGAKATSPGNITIDVFLNVSTRLGYVVVPLLAGATVQAFFGGRMTVRAVGSPGSSMVTPGLLTISNTTTAIPGTTFDGGTSVLDTAVAQALTVNITFDIADVANTVTLQDAQVDVEYVDLTVS